MTHQLPHDVAALVKLAASHAEGHQALFEGHLESVASLYQVHPERLERAREAFTAPHARRLACELADASPRVDRRPLHTRAPQKDAQTLLMEAMASPTVMDVLLRAPMELAAVQLGAHPFVVEEARLRHAANPLPPVLHLTQGERAS